MTESNLFDIILEALLNRIANGYPLVGEDYYNIALDLKDCVDVLEDISVQEIVPILAYIDGGNFIGENRT